MATAKVTPVPVPGSGPSGAPKVMPTDALMPGVHSALNVASRHRRMVSGALELKHESAGHRGNPSAYNNGKKAFKTRKAKVK